MTSGHHHLKFDTSHLPLKRFSLRHPNARRGPRLFQSSFEIATPRALPLRAALLEYLLFTRDRINKGLSLVSIDAGL